MEGKYSGLLIIFNKETVNESAHSSIGLSRQDLLPINDVVDSCAGLNAVSYEVVNHLGWSTTVLNVDISCLYGVNGGHFQILGVTVSYVRFGDLTVRVYFTVPEFLLIP